MYVHASRALSDNTCLVKDRLVVLESGLESTFARLGLGLELKGLGTCYLWTRTWQFFQQVLLQVHFTKCTCGEGVQSRGLLYYCTLQLAVQAL